MKKDRISKESVMDYLGILIAITFFIIVLVSGLNSSNATLKDLELRNDALKILNKYLDEKYSGKIKIDNAPYFTIDEDRQGIYLETEHLNAYVDLKTEKCYDDYEKEIIIKYYNKLLNNVVDYGSVARTDIVYSDVPDYDYLINIKFNGNNIIEILTVSDKNKQLIALHNYDLSYINLDNFKQLLGLNKSEDINRDIECFILNVNNIRGINSITDLNSSNLDDYALYIQEYVHIGENRDTTKCFEILESNGISYIVDGEYSYIDFILNTDKLIINTDGTNIKLWVPSDYKLDTGSFLPDSIDGYNIYNFDLNGDTKLELDILQEVN